MLKKSICLALLILTLATSSHAARAVACDLCGLCKYDGKPAPTPPGNWVSCVRCVYGINTPNPAAPQTLEIDPLTNGPKSPRVGAYYTEIGCVQGVGGFENLGGVGGVVFRLIDIVQRVVVVVAFLTLLYGGFLFIVGRGDFLRISRAKALIRRAILGLLFGIFSTFIIRFLASALKIPGFT